MVGFGNADVPAFLDDVDSLTLHDAMIVASHHTQDTDAVITSDGAISESDVPTVWA